MINTFRETREEPSWRAGESDLPSSAEPSRGDLLHLYLREIGRVKLLTPEEEIALAGRIRKGDTEAREQMIKANLRLVVKMAREYEHLGLPLLDLINEGNIGLMKGIERFDPSKGAKLSSYASFWIKQSIMRALANQSRTIRLPVWAIDKLAAIRQAETRLQETLAREASDEEIAHHLGNTNARHVGRLRAASRKPVELDAPLETNSDSRLVSEMVADPNAQAPFAQLTKHGDQALVQEAFTTLDKRERTILKMRFGLDSKRPTTLEKIGQTFGITRERVRQLQNEALKKMRAVIQQQDGSLPIRNTN